MMIRNILAATAVSFFALTAALPASATVVGAVIATSTQGVGNTADVYGANYGDFLPNGIASFDQDPTVLVPPGNLSGVYQSPFNNTSLAETRNYFSVGGVDSNGDGATSPVTLSLGGLTSAFSILWGSIDDYNTLEFLDTLGNVISSFTGTDIIALGAFSDGFGPGFEGVALLNFTADAGSEFSAVRFRSTQAAFEFALAPVPLPAGGLLLIGAIGGLAALRRRKAVAV